MTLIEREEPSDGVLLLRLNRPDSRNALNQQMREELADAFMSAAGEDGIRAIVLTGTSEAFSAGADIKSIVEKGPAEMMALKSHRYWEAIARCPKPIIAAVNGYALAGGCELAMHADIIVAGENSTFGLTEVGVGVMPGAGGTQRLTRAVGKFKAMLICLTGQTFSGRHAFEIGLVSKLVPDGDVVQTALDLARRIAGLPALAVMQIKEVVLAGENASLETALLLERKAFHLLFDTADQKEGMRAFTEKREPKFQGR